MPLKQRAGVVPRWTTIQLLLSHGIVGATVALVMMFLSRFFFEPDFWLQLLVGGCIFGCLMGFLFTINITNDLSAVELILIRLVHGLRVEQISARYHWPVSHLLSLLNVLAQQRDTQWSQEQQTSEYRNQLLQQVAKTAAQEERNRLARDLHDSIKQQIFSVVVSAAAVKARWEHDSAGARKVVDDIQRNAQEAQVEMQALLQQLRPFPLENVGLTEALRTQCQALGYRTGAQVNLELGELPPDETLPPGIQEMLFRIAQEGFANIARHARASHVWVRLYQKDDELLLEIEDDGQGFELAQIGKQTMQGGMGLSNVRERVQAMKGSVTIWSKPDAGTKLAIGVRLLTTQMLQMLQKVQEMDEELEVVVHRTKGLLRVGTWLANLAALVVLLYAPPPFASVGVLASIPVLLLIYFLARNYRTHIAILPQGKTSLLLMTAESYLLLAKVFLLCALVGCYIYIITNYIIYIPYLSHYISNSRIILFIIAPGIFVTFSLVFLIRFLIITGQYRDTLPLGEFKARTRRQLLLVALNFLAWLIIAVITITLLFHSYPIYVRSFLSFTGIFTYPHILLLLAWFILNVVSCFQLWSWRRCLSGKEV